MIILASKSPRRKQLMGEKITKDFIVEVSHSDESFPNELKTPQEIVSYIANQKGKELHNKYFSDTVISADTIVVIDNKIIGKPKDQQDAFNILKTLSGRTHFVYTAYSIFKGNEVINSLVKSEVIFFDLEDKLILDYINTGSPMDKAGAYGIQDSNYHLVKEVIGSIDNVIGFPADEIKKDLAKLGSI